MALASHHVASDLANYFKMLLQRKSCMQKAPSSIAPFFFSETKIKSKGEYGTSHKINPVHRTDIMKKNMET